MNKKHDNSENSSLIITYAQLQGVVVIIFIGMVFIFIAGYFWGKKSSQEELIKNYEQEAFADKVYTSLCSLCESLEEEKMEKIEEGPQE
jgi:hypothetical protein